LIGLTRIHSSNTFSFLELSINMTNQRKDASATLSTDLAESPTWCQKSALDQNSSNSASRSNRPGKPVYYGIGNDIITLGNENNIVYAGEGINLITTGMGNDLIYAGAGADFINAGNGRDMIFAGEGNNRILAGKGNDMIYAGSGNDMIYGGAGDDVIYAGNGNNIVNAGTGNDTVFFGSGTDKLILEGGKGAVTLIGFDLKVDKLRLGESLVGKELKFVAQGNDTLVMSGKDRLATLKEAKGGSRSIVDQGPLYRYVATDLGSLSTNAANGNVLAASINDFGQIAGRFDTGALFTNTSALGVINTANAATQAFIWENGVQTALTSDGIKVGSSDFGAANGAAVTLLTARASKINNLGVITGTHDEVRQPVPLATDRGLRWVKDGAAYQFTINDSGGKETYFFDANDTNQIAGRNIKTVGTGTVNTPIAVENGEYTFLSVGSGVNGTAFGINESGTLVGVVSGSATGTDTAAIWQKDGSGKYQLTANTFGFDQATLRDLNNAGDMIGQVTSGTGTAVTSSPFLMRDGEFVNLGSLGGKTGATNGINEFGQVVGASQIASGTNRAYVYEGGGMIADLNNLVSTPLTYNGAAVTLTNAASVNNFGQIVATGTYTYKDTAGKNATGTRSYVLNAA
jgi:probable HAF family extracellular repeat protein